VFEHATKQNGATHARHILLKVLKGNNYLAHIQSYSCHYFPWISKVLVEIQILMLVEGHFQRLSHEAIVFD
jgi:hypothetical protein